MITLRCQLYDGKSATPHRVAVTIDDDGNVSRGEPFAYQCHLRDLDISQRVGNIPRQIRFADGVNCETRDNDQIDMALRLAGLTKGTSDWAFKLEASWRWALLSLLLIIPTVWLMVDKGVPFVAKQVAFQMPVEVDSVMGKDALAVLDRTLFKPSKLPQATRDRLHSKFEAMTRNIKTDFSYTLEFRQSPHIGANAFALPAGIIVMTDELVDLAKGDNEVLSVLAHEIGHVEERHHLRGAMQNTVIATVMIALTGDVSWIASALPILLAEARHSRTFENEADEYALKYMRQHGIALESFPNILNRLHQSHCEKTESCDDAAETDTIGGYFSSHPAPKERAERFRD